MERIVIVSTNNNPDYYCYSPYIKKAWNNFGWKVAVMYTADVDAGNVLADYYIRLPEVDGLRKETIAQVGRLYAANYFSDERILMTSDMDLLPLRDYWNPDPSVITNYGHDLTDFSFYPMGYTAMTVTNWKKVMKLTGNTEADMLRDAHEPIEYSPFSGNWEQWWNYDWSLLTKRLKENMPITTIMRGRRAGSCFAYGRVDRGDSMQNPGGDLIDAHLENHNSRHPDKWNKFIELFNTVHGEQ